MKRGGNFVKLLPTLIEGGAELGIATASAQLILAQPQHSLLLGSNGKYFYSVVLVLYFLSGELVASPRPDYK